MNDSMLKDVAEWGVVYTMKMSTRRPISSYVCMLYTWRAANNRSMFSIDICVVKYCAYVYVSFRGYLVIIVLINVSIGK
jgi:hypothetical protein